MSGHIEMDGEVIESVRGTISVQLEGAEAPVKCHLAGKMKTNKINVLVGDLVRVKISPYDLTRGIVVFRYKNKK